MRHFFSACPVAALSSGVAASPRPTILVALVSTLDRAAPGALGALSGAINLATVAAAKQTTTRPRGRQSARCRSAEQQHQLTTGSPIETPPPPGPNAGKCDPAGIPRRIDADSGRQRHCPARTVGAAIIAPAANIACMNLHLQEISAGHSRLNRRAGLRSRRVASNGR